MASDGSEVVSAPAEDQRDDGTQLTDTPSSDPGVPADPNSGKGTLNATAGKSICLVLHSNCLLFVKRVPKGYLLNLRHSTYISHIKETPIYNIDLPVTCITEISLNLF